MSYVPFCRAELIISIVRCDRSRRSSRRAVSRDGRLTALDYRRPVGLQSNPVLQHEQGGCEYAARRRCCDGTWRSASGVGRRWTCDLGGRRSTCSLGRALSGGSSGLVHRPLARRLLFGAAGASRRRVQIPRAGSRGRGTSGLSTPCRRAPAYGRWCEFVLCSWSFCPCDGRHLYMTQADFDHWQDRVGREFRSTAGSSGMNGERGYDDRNRKELCPSQGSRNSFERDAR